MYVPEIKLDLRDFTKKLRSCNYIHSSFSSEAKANFDCHNPDPGAHGEVLDPDVINSYWYYTYSCSLDDFNVCSGVLWHSLIILLNSQG